jgi:hypothetical protein
MVDPDDLAHDGDVLDKAAEVYRWFDMLQLVGFDQAQAFVLLPPLLMGGHILRRDT